MIPKPTSLTIGIAGGTGSGKTTLAKGLLHSFGAGEACLLDLDSYYLDRTHLSEQEKTQVNYDEPQAIDHKLLLEHLQLLISGNQIQKPVYCFDFHGRSGRTQSIRPSPFIIVEGLFTFCDRAIRQLFDIKIYVEADPDIRFIRRMGRDMLERGRSAESVVEQYMTSVRPMHQLHIEPSKGFADLVLQNNATGEILVAQALQAIRQLGGNAPQLGEQSHRVNAAI